MEATKTLQREHTAVLTVLDRLEEAIDAVERGHRVPGDIFADLAEFFTIFVDRCHHAKEEQALFPRLATNGPIVALLRQLETEHATGRQLAAAYREAVTRYTPGDPASGRKLAEAARAYAAFLRSHIAREDAELLPLVERTLADRDADLGAQFDTIEAVQIGVGVHERLHQMIARLPVRLQPWLIKASS